MNLRTLFAATFILSAPVALAETSSASTTPPDKAPAAQAPTLPDQASDSARKALSDNAFGKKGAAQRAAAQAKSDQDQAADQDEDKTSTDKTTKTLPAQASDTARQAAFGQKGAAQRAAEQAARQQGTAQAQRAASVEAQRSAKQAAARVAGREQASASAAEGLSRARVASGNVAPSAPGSTPTVPAPTDHSHTPPTPPTTGGR